MGDHYDRQTSRVFTTDRGAFPSKQCGHRKRWQFKNSDSKLSQTHLNMKTIAVIGILQLVLTFFLLSRVIELDQRKNGDANPTSQTAPQQTAITHLMQVPRTDAPEVLDEQKLRNIVREELQAQLSELAISEKPVPDNTVSETVSDAEYQYRFEAVAQNLEYFLEKGRISDAEMSSIQADIARLDPEGRRQMMGQLVRAINSGEIEGTF